MRSGVGSDANQRDRVRLPVEGHEGFEIVALLGDLFEAMKASTETDVAKDAVCYVAVDPIRIGMML